MALYISSSHVQIKLYYMGVTSLKLSLLMNQMVRISFLTRYDELKSEVWLLKFYLTIRHVSTQESSSGIFFQGDFLMNAMEVMTVLYFSFV